MKKIFKIAIIICIIFFAENVYALECIEENYFNKNGIKMTCEQVKKLENLGFTDYQIYHMDQDEFDANKNLNGEVLSETTKYYKIVTYYPSQINTFSTTNLEPLIYSEEITKEEYENAEPSSNTRGLSNGITSTEYKLMTSTIINPGNGNYRYKNTVSWKKLPAIKNYDIIGIGIEETKVYGISSSKYVKSIFSYNSTNACFEKTTTTGTWNLSPSGYSVKFKLPYTSSYAEWTGLETYMYFDVAKQNTSGNISVLNAYGNYRHATTNLPNVSFSFGITVYGVISVGASYQSSYDEISTAQATLTGISW